MNIEIVLSGLPTSLNKLKTMHWAKKAREAKTWRAATCYMAKKVISQLKPIPKLPFKAVCLTFIRASSQPMDPDNGIGSIKPLIDGLRDSGIIANDDPSVVKTIHHGWEKSRPGHGFIKIIIEEVNKECI